MQSLLWLVVLCSAAVLVNATEEPPRYTDHPKTTPTTGYYNHPPSRGYPGRRRFSHPGPKRRPFHPPRGGYLGQFYPPPFEVLPPSPKKREPLTQLDRLNKRVHTIYSQILFFSEKADALATALSILETRINKITTIKMDVFNSTHTAQKVTANEINQAVSSNIAQEIGSVSSKVNDLASLNQVNTEWVAQAESGLATQQARDVQQQKGLGSLNKKMNDLKPKLIQVMENSLAGFDVVLERDDIRLKSIKKRESDRRCELGEVNMKEGEYRVEYPYQNEFGSRPGAYIYGLQAFSFDRKTHEEEPTHVGYGPPSKEPESKGVTVHAYTSPKSLVLQLFDESYGKTKLKNAVMSFYVCSIGPGASKVNYYYY